MIYLQIQGGLGNQMFQYAAAYALAREKKTSVAISTDKMNRMSKEPGLTVRNFELNDVFSLPYYKMCNEHELDYIQDPYPGFFRRLKRRIKGISVFYEKNLQYDPAIRMPGREIYIEGYFQSVHYFESCQAEIRRAFQFRREPSLKTQQLLQHIIGFNTIAVHVRRGDFVASEANLKTHGVCPPAYYEQAAGYFETDENTCFVVVSDDPAWVKANIRLGQNTIYADWNQGVDSWQDMLIISRCNHAIIANSSFSWWGAYLIDNQYKKVIAPKIWYADIHKQAQTKDLIPAGWVRI